MKNLFNFLAIVCSLLLSTQSYADTWSGDVASSFSAGTGSQTNPYIIASADEFAFFVKSVNDGATYSGLYIKQTKDIDMSTGSLSVTTGKKFAGNYNGNNYALKLNSKVFACVSGQIHNVRVYSEYGAALVDSVASGAYIYNIYRYCKSPYARYSDVTGLIARVNNGYIYNCAVNAPATASGSSSSFALAITYTNNGNIRNCISTVTEDEWTHSSCWYGCNSYLAYYNKGTIYQCFANGHIVCTNDGSITYTYCNANTISNTWNSTGTASNNTALGYGDTQSIASIYKSYISTLNSWANSYTTSSRIYSTWADATIPLVDLVPLTYAVEYVDTCFGYKETKNITYGESLGTLPVPTGNATFIGWYDGTTKVTESSAFDMGVSLYAKWSWNVISQPSAKLKTISVEDEEHASYQWYKMENYYDFGDWTSDNYNQASTTSKQTYNFHCNAGAVLSLKYLVSCDTYDKFYLKINGNTILTKYGYSITTTDFSYTIPDAGDYELELSYVKDASGNYYSDKAIITDIKVCDPPIAIEGQSSKTLTAYEKKDAAYLCKVNYSNNSTVLTSDAFALKFHTIKYIVDGEDYLTEAYEEGQTITPPDMTKLGYNFSGWTDIPDVMGTEDVIVNGAYSMISDTDVSSIDNTVYIENTEASAGSQLTLSLNMKNTVSAQGFQCDVYLPEGATFATDEDGFYQAALSTARTTATKTNYFDCALQSDGALRILCNSTKGYTFSGNDGEVATIIVNLGSDMDEGDYPIIIKEIEISDKESQSYTQSYIKSTLTISSYTLGDANNDGKITVTDFTAVANDILGNPPATYVKKAADVNLDNKVTVSDLTGIANIILYGSITGGVSNAKAMNADTWITPTVYIPEITVQSGSMVNVPVYINNASTAFSAYQMDIMLPEGMKLEGVQIVNDRITDHVLQSAQMADGAYRLLSYSTKNNDFLGDNGAVAILTISTDNIACGTYTGEAKNIELSENASPCTPSASKITINVTEPTGINQITGNDGSMKFYNISGVQSKSAQKGINIIRNADGSIHKTIIK